MTPNRSNIERVKRAGVTHAINCYGTVAFALGKIPEPRWLAPWELDCLVLGGCSPLNRETDFKPGDVVVVCAPEYPSTVHCAVYVGPGDKWFHKCGGTAAKYDTLQEVLDSYFSVAHVFARPRDERTLAELKGAA